MADKFADQKKRDKSSGTALYEAERAALLARTEKLRALRLAHEAEEAAKNPPPPVKEKKPARAARSGTAAKSKAKAPSKKLADWMKTQEDGGHRN